MTDEQKQNLRLALQDLRANPNKAIGHMRNEAGGRCCLCVIAETAAKIKGLDKNAFITNSGFPTCELKEIFGLPNEHQNGTLFNFVIKGSTASCWNDGECVEEKSHVEIADMIEEEYLK